jgi:hypothetical protein
VKEDLSLKFKIGPTPTLAKLYEEQGLNKDALTIYKHLNTLEDYDFTEKIVALQELIKASQNLFTKQDKEANISINDQETTSDKIDEKVSSAPIDEAIDEIEQKKVQEVEAHQMDQVNIDDNDRIEAKETELADGFSEESEIAFPVFSNLINALFTDSDKRNLRIVPNDDYFYNNVGSLIVKEHESREVVGEIILGEIEPVEERDKQVITEQVTEIINSDMKLGELLNIIVTNYDLDTRLSEVKVSELIELFGKKI